MNEFQTLDQCSAFPFENYMYQLKKFCSLGRNVFTQIVKRLSEMVSLMSVAHSQTKPFSSFFKHPNNAFMLRKFNCCVVVSADSANNSDDRDQQEVKCRIFRRSRPLFTITCSSFFVGICVVKSRDTVIKVIKRSELLHQTIKIESDRANESIFMAVLPKF